MSAFIRNHKLLTTFGVLAVGTSTLLIKKENRIVAKETWSGVKRGYKLSTTVMSIALDYKWSFRGIDNGTETYKRVEKVVNTRSAEKTLKLFLDLGGIFTKCGQMMSSARILPPEWIEIMSKCQDSAKYVPFDDVKRVFKEDIGVEAEDIFEQIDQKPIGAASLAQVHKAILKSGEEVAVKIQYPHLRKEMVSDIHTVERLSKIIQKLFPTFRFGFMVQMMKENLDKELNFMLEANNAIGASNFFKETTDIYIPKVYSEYTSERVLVMEFIKGCKITDVDTIHSMGFDMKPILRSFMKAFGDYMFVYGDIHVDPHPGNILVRPNPVKPSSAQVVIIDHGMYRKIDDEYRIHFCNLWQAVVLRDKKTVKEECEFMKVGSLAPVISFMFVGQSMDSQKKVGSVVTKEEMMKMREQHMKMRKNKGDHMTLEKMSEIMEQMPDDFKFIFRTMQICNGVYQLCGGSNSERLYILTDSSQKGLDMVNHQSNNYSLKERFIYTYHLAKLRVRLMYFDIYLPLMQLIMPLYFRYLKYMYPDMFKDEQTETKSVENKKSETSQENIQQEHTEEQKEFDKERLNSVELTRTTQ